MMNLLCFTVARDMAVPMVDGTPTPDTTPATFDAALLERPAAPVTTQTPSRTATLEELAWARSGEKGETINIGGIARKAEDLPALRAALTQERLHAWLPDLGAFRVTVYDLPGINALNLVMVGALPGGLNASQRLDPAAKSIAQRLMRFPVAL
jgi:hypothetical protein